MTRTEAVTDPLRQPRSLDYHILKTCERLGLREHEFFAAPYTDQIRWLSYAGLRDREESQAVPRGL